MDCSVWKALGAGAGDEVASLVQGGAVGVVVEGVAVKVVGAGLGDRVDESGTTAVGRRVRVVRHLKFLDGLLAKDARDAGAAASLAQIGAGEAGTVHRKIVRSVGVSRVAATRLTVPKSPSALTFGVSRTKSVAATRTAGMAAPEGSVTRPEMAPVEMALWRATMMGLL